MKNIFFACECANLLHKNILIIRLKILKFAAQKCYNSLHENKIIIEKIC